MTRRRRNGRRGTRRATRRSLRTGFGAAPATRLALVVVGTALLSAAGCQRPPSTAYVPGLGEIMTLTQMRHVKLWFAGEAENWPLADYELDELEEGFADAARFHPTHKDAPRPLTELIPDFTEVPIRRLRAAVAEKDISSFSDAYDALTAGCNDCHQVAGFSFNVLTRPTSNPYSDQDFHGAK